MFKFSKKSLDKFEGVNPSLAQYKIELAHNNVTKDSPPEDRYKGSVFTVSPWKDL